MITATTHHRRRVAAALAVLGLAAASFVGATAASADGHLVNSVEFTGQGLDEFGEIEEVICDEFDSPYVLFVLAGTKATEAMLIDDVADMMEKSGKGNGGAFKLEVDTSNLMVELADLEVTALYDGPERNAQLVISHGCPGDYYPPS